MTGAIAVMSSYGAVAPSGPAFDFYSPPQLVSASFNGSSQSLSATNAAFTQAGDFTVEGWYYPTNVTGTHSLFCLGTEAANRYIWQLNGAAINSNLYGNTSVAYTGSLSINTWYHIAVVRSGSTVTLYVNGTANATTDTQAGTIGNGVLRIGADGSGATRFAGNISNFRVAASAVYTGNFTAPNSPLSPTGSVFFASLGVTAFVDYSTNAISITNTGTVIIANSSPFSTTWTDSVSAIAATVATNVNSSGNNPTYDARYGGGLMFAENPRQTYVDVPTSYNGAAAFTISLAANIPQNTGAHYTAIFCSNVATRSGNGIMSRHWVGDGFEAGNTSNWLASNSVSSPSMGTLAWWDYVYNGSTITLYKNGSQIFTGNMGSANTGWLNPLRFGGDESVVGSNNTMATGILYRMKCQPGALSSGQITTQYNAVKSTYGLP